MCEKDENTETRQLYFDYWSNSGQKMCTNSKMIQINSTDLYIIGGHIDYPSLLSRRYDPSTATLKVEINTGVLTKMSDMLRGRMSFGICHIGHHIYVIGGQSNIDRFKVMKKCARYNVLKDKWSGLPEEIPVK